MITEWERWRAEREAKLPPPPGWDAEVYLGAFLRQTGPFHYLRGYRGMLATQATGLLVRDLLALPRPQAACVLSLMTAVMLGETSRLSRWVGAVSWHLPAMLLELRRLGALAELGEADLSRRFEAFLERDDQAKRWLAHARFDSLAGPRARDSVSFMTFVSLIGFLLAPEATNAVLDRLTAPEAPAALRAELLDFRRRCEESEPRLEAWLRQSETEARADEQTEPAG